jgi:photosystem II stability/assembly factor-like uncharacterized protein
MKKVIFVIIFSFLFISFSFPQSGWVIYSTSTNKPIHDIYFVDANTGWAVGDSVIVRSTNGGVNWVQQYYYYPGVTIFRSVKFINQYTGFVGGGNFASEFTHDQYIFKTTNGGVNWSILWHPVSTPGWVTNILPINDNTIYIGLSGYIELNSVGGFYKSTNGGQSFFRCLPEYGNSNSIYFINEFTGWVTTYATHDLIDSLFNNKIYKTNNGGINWITQWIDSDTNTVIINKIQFSDLNSGYAIGDKYNKTVFYKTTNGGTNWDTTIFDNFYKYSSMYFVNPGSGWISGSYYPDSASIAYTTNGGTTWLKQFKNYSYYVLQLMFINNLTGWATLGYNSSNILRTTTGGAVFVRNISSEIP